MKYLLYKDLLFVVPISLLLSAGLACLQYGNWLTGFFGFSLLTLLGFLALTAATRWASGGKALARMVVLAFVLRFAGGVSTYLALPVDGYDEPDDRAGYVYTDAHRRDVQAWELASSDHPITDAFSRKFFTDQYGGLLGLSAFVYRYLSPDAHRPLMLILLSALIAALGLPFLWRAASQMWGGKIALASGWVFTLYPESILLGSSAMREPYLMMFSAFALWGFVDWQQNRSRSAWLPLSGTMWLALGLLGMVLVSPVVALMTLIILAGWLYSTSERGRDTWWMIILGTLIFIATLFLLSLALNRQGNLGNGTPIGVIGNFLREAVKWDVYQLERGSGWVQKLFDEMPAWLRLPFVVVYGLFQPILPAALVEPTTLTWRIIAILRALGWYMLLPMLILSFLAAAKTGRSPKSVEESEKDRRLWIWITVISWTWILLAALRGGGDQWDNPRYRAILFMWQAILAGYVWVWWREARNAWGARVVAMEAVFLLFFGQWYANRYFHFGGQLVFWQMVAVILGLWGVILLSGWIWDRRRLTGGNGSL